MLPRDFTQQENLISKYLTNFGIRYEQQHVFEPYIVDFWIPELGMVIEADGAYGHFKKKDALRDSVLLRYPEVETVVHIKEESKKNIKLKLWETLS